MLCQGLSGFPPPGTFQRLMERIFGGCRYQSVFLYLDDVIIFSTTVKQHLV